MSLELAGDKPCFGPELGETERGGGAKAGKILYLLGGACSNIKIHDMTYNIRRLASYQNVPHVFEGRSLFTLNVSKQIGGFQECLQLCDPNTYEWNI